MVTVIAAVAQNNALGKNNELLWHLPDDFKHFKFRTTGKHIIMGRKTFESLPKLLPNRTHIIISRQQNYVHKLGFENCIVVENLAKALAICPSDTENFIIGGGEIYAQSIDFADTLDITKVHHDFDADVFFPEIDLTIWQLKSEIFHPKDDKHLYDFSFQTFIKKKKDYL